MSITVDEYLRLKKICEPKRKLNLPGPLTDEVINEAIKQLPLYQVYRLEAATRVARKEWPTLAFPRYDGLGNITPNGVEQAVEHAYWRLSGAVVRVTREKAISGEGIVRLAYDGTLRCPWCGQFLKIPEEIRNWLV
ncbi:MAG: hypothetical protein PHQ43_03990 [Dehalococcoidales bacterium]|nr:hypothetical protein [Dehalococcoidales bacterium]